MKNENKKNQRYFKILINAIKVYKNGKIILMWVNCSFKFDPFNQWKRKKIRAV